MRAAVQAERWDRAVEVAARVLRKNETCHRTFQYGNAIHWANIALGHAALARGETPVAATFLKAAGETPGSPQLNSFGPDTHPAGALVAAGERDAVLHYLEGCKRFWSDHALVIDRSKFLIESGEKTPFEVSEDE